MGLRVCLRPLQSAIAAAANVSISRRGALWNSLLASPAHLSVYFGGPWLRQGATRPAQEGLTSPRPSASTADIAVRTIDLGWS
jgi:hypothetical protein